MIPSHVRIFVCTTPQVRRDHRGVRYAGDHLTLRARVAFPAERHPARLPLVALVLLDELREVDGVAADLDERVDVRLVPVGRHLEAAEHSRPKIRHERSCTRRGPFPDEKRDHRAVRDVLRDVRPLVADHGRVVGLLDPLLLLFHERPLLIDLDERDSQVAHEFVVEHQAPLAEIKGQLVHRRLVDEANA